eukprot:scaffold287_cov119-Isochrysis_galbana.AAC.7
MQSSRPQTKDSWREGLEAGVYHYLVVGKPPMWFSHVARAHRWVAPLNKTYVLPTATTAAELVASIVPSPTRHPSIPLRHPMTIRYVQSRPPSACRSRKPPNSELAQSA